MTIVGLTVDEGDVFEIYVRGPNPCVADPAACIGSRTYAFKVVGGKLVETYLSTEKVTKVVYTSLSETTGRITP